MEQKTFSVEAMTEEEFCKLAQEGRILGIIGKEVEIIICQMIFQGGIGMLEL